MSRRQLAFSLICLASSIVATPRDDPSTNSNWPTILYWMTGGVPPTTPPMNQNLPQPAMGWPNPYAYAPFGQPAPFGFLQGQPPLLFYGGYPPLHAMPLNGAETIPSTGEETPMIVDSATGSNSAGIASSTPRTPPQDITAAGPSRHREVPTAPRAWRESGTDRDNAPRPRWRSPSPRRSRSTRHDVDDTEEDDRRDRKGKRRASPREMERQQISDDHLRRWDEGRETERARRHAEEAPILEQVMELQARELTGDDSTAGALQEQLSMNIDLMRRCKELEKMLHKRQSSPEWDHHPSPKRHRDSRFQHQEYRRHDEIDEFLEGDGDYPARRHWAPREQGRGGHSAPRGRDGHLPSRGRDATPGRPLKQPIDAVTTIPERHQWLPGEDAHDLELDSYDQRWFAEILEDMRMPLEERIAELSLESMVDIIEGAGASSDEETDKRKPNSVQRGRKFVERRNHRLRHPGTLPTWLETIRNAEAATGTERDNSFWGMYGPGFTHDPRTNIMYTDREAVEASRMLADGAVVPVPVDMADQLNPRGFPMNVREVQESATFVHMRRPGWQGVLHLLWEFHRISTSVVMRYRDLSMHEVVEVFEKDDRLAVLAQRLLHPYFIPIDPQYLHTGSGTTANGVGLATPVNGTLDDWCQYTAHHFRLNGLNPTSEVMMDTSYHVSFASIWGMLLMRFLHPQSSTKKYYARYFAGIAYRPRYYVDFIRSWNAKRTMELPISVAAGSPVLRRMVFNGAGENLSELDVIRHLAACAITQEMLDSMYIWALIWVDQHSSVHFRDHNRALELERLERIRQYGEPITTASLQGWWSPDEGDTHRIRALLYSERYKSQSSGRPQSDRTYWLLCGEDSRFCWLNEFPPTNPNLMPAIAALELSAAEHEPDVPMTLDDGDGDAELDDAALNGATDNELMDGPMPSPDEEQKSQRAHSA
ncbi:uncharacterized protein ARMOST_19894 [Armillaria ostoyae]|uniref:Uncharacterized protein n=1 Tax=Armillaria ostoyae TaxID=47428 RepID=A0A284S5U3_ARMOS|nr:uncharacterized protein ARMOST_19894 [Armillaria ostoyae]